MTLPSNSSMQGSGVKVDCELRQYIPGCEQVALGKEEVSLGRGGSTVSRFVKSCGFAVKQQQVLASWLSRLPQRSSLLRAILAVAATICVLATWLNCAFSWLLMATISSEILPKRTSMMASVRMSRTRVLSVKMMMIFFQKLSCMNQVRTFRGATLIASTRSSRFSSFSFPFAPSCFALPFSFCFCFYDSSIRYLLQSAVTMRRDDMRVAPLAVLYQHKNHYDHHRRKLDSIRGHRPNLQAENFERMELVRQNLHKFEQRQHTRSLELARQNEKIVKKLENVRSFISFKNSLKPQQVASPLSRIPSCKSKSFIREGENERFKVRVKSMGSDLSRKGMQRDYERSMQIKNRIMRYQTEHNNKVSLKAGKVLSANQHRSNIISARAQDKGKFLPLLAKAENKIKLLSKADETAGKGKKADPVPRRSNHYRKEQIKSKLQMQKRVFKLTQEQRFRTECISRQDNLLKGQEKYTFCTAVDYK